jgi:hypothetical protein
MGLPGTISAASALWLLLAGAPGASKEAHTLQDALQICARIQDPTDRLACFEGLARSTAPDAAGAGASAEQARSMGPATATEQRAAKKARAANASEQRAARQAAQKTASQQRAAAKERRRQAETDSQRRPYDAVVMRAWQYVSGDYYIALTNGEIWKSQGQDGGRPVKDGEAVELHPGFAGSWFIEFRTVKRPALRVQLVE